MSFMNKILSMTGASALAIGVMVAFGAEKAEAVTVSFTGGIGGNTGTVLSGGDGSVKQNSLANGTANIDFDWDSTSPDSFLAYSEFTTNASFRLTFQDYAPESDLLDAEGARSGFQLYYGDFDSGALTAILPHTPNTETACGADVQASFGSTDCVLVTGAGNDGTPFVVPPITYDINGYGAGTYVLMFSEGNDPNNGSAEFIISAVPLPAGGLLLLTALGGVAVLRRKRKAA
ncbi:VPLPA-CTERM sorting domain-containing protein [Aquicoccus sp.]|uniref:VPLPA-CTERM sorting domain-containing protein n=1 Tax=Aquicoccus sp. TaxID=2055851 RepID=UPI003569F42E